jgi:hypothetical protein
MQGKEEIHPDNLIYTRVIMIYILAKEMIVWQEPTKCNSTDNTFAWSNRKRWHKKKAPPQWGHLCKRRHFRNIWHIRKRRHLPKDNASQWSKRRDDASEWSNRKDDASERIEPQRTRLQKDRTAKTTPPTDRTAKDSAPTKRATSALAMAQATPQPACR